VKELCVCGVLAEVLMLSAGLLHSLGAATSQHWERASFEATFDGLSVDVAMLADDPGCSPCLPKKLSVIYISTYQMTRAVSIT